jgi:hypothetical protein
VKGLGQVVELKIEIALGRQAVLLTGSNGTAINRQIQEKPNQIKERKGKKAKEMKVEKGEEKREKSWRNGRTITFCVRRVR